MKTRKEMVKALIELSTTIEEADKVIEEHTKLKSLNEKIAFLDSMFDYIIIDAQKDDSEEIIYNLMLYAIINKKWKV